MRFNRKLVIDSVSKLTVMGFQQPNLATAAQEIRRCAAEIRSPYNDGWTQMSCKHQLYQLKCLLDDVYNTLPQFSGEQEWEQERLIEILKR
jgi:hypothetical protein